MQRAEEVCRLVVQARQLFWQLDRGRVAPGGHGPSGSGGTQMDAPVSSPPLGVSGPSDRRSAEAPPTRAVRTAEEPGWNAETRALELVRSEGQRLVDEATDRLFALEAERSSHLKFLIDHPDWPEPQDPPQGCLSGGLP